MRRLNRGVFPIFAALAVMAAIGAHAFGQTPGAQQQLTNSNGAVAPSFEVAIVNPARLDSAGTNYEIAPDRFNAKSVTVKNLIEFAYNVKTSGGIEGEPKWTGSEKFDIEAKIGDAAVEAMKKLQPSLRIAQYRLMMRSLLAERFGLKTSIQTRELPVYALVVAKNGSKLTPLEPNRQHTPMLWGGSKGTLHARSVSMPLFADWISGSGDTDGRAVIDRTGLAGSYDFTLNWTRMESGANAMGEAGANQPTAGAIAIDNGAPSFFTALREQLGLKLEPAKGPVKVIVVEHVERPSPN